MSVLIQVTGAYKSYGEQVLLDDAEFTMHEGMKIGFVGRNGAGKSTLLRVMLGEEELDAGQVQLNSRLRVGYLRQHDPFLPDESALDFLMRDSDQPDWKCGEVAGRFEIKGAYLNGPVRALSGGWQTRVKLAALLLHEPTLLLLDEPTNFLDLRTQILLEHFLRSFKEACLIVSHDRHFLKATCHQTLDLSRGKLTLYPGQVDAFLTYQEERLEHDRRVNAAVISKQQQLQKFIDKNKARASTATQARSKSKQLEKLQTIDIVADLPTANIRAPRVKPRGGPAVRCEDLAIGYPDHQVAGDIRLEIEHGQRVAIVGDNGQGKTTLLRTLVGSLEPKAGNVRWGHGCEVGVYAQHVYTSLPERFTVLEFLEREALPGTTNQEILAQAGALLFRGEAVEKKIKVLSGGERARLCLAGLMLGNSNILVLDEPGNHLDVETIESLAEALIQYEGTVIFTSHDRHFMKRIATSIIEVGRGTARTYAGDYDAYLYYINQEIEDGRRLEAGPNTSPTDRKAPKVVQPTEQVDERKLRKELSNLEKKIARLDDEKRAKESQLMTESNATVALRLHEDATKLKAELAELEIRWLELQELLGYNY
ncbi:MAG: ABC-F family ATP-binding cassette domain-containing protein [Planctomycetaceae bacterium]|jgi:ATP-binding cassette, subfamily F, member 3|nr:ABC-F family ATP-binding cassette domain-containing protein [Planctomycetaceae bacterium]